jgi:hypothetical protein
MRDDMEINAVVKILDALKPLNIEECNGAYQTMVAERIVATGKDIKDFTIREMEALIERARDEFNRTGESSKRECNACAIKDSCFCDEADTGLGCDDWQDPDDYYEEEFPEE